MGAWIPTRPFLLDRGIKTLALRLDAQSRNAVAIARFLSTHTGVERVHYCGLESDPHHARAERLLDGFGGLLSFVVRGGDDRASEVLQRLTLFAEAASLGSVESLACRPRDLSHAHLSDEERRLAGIAPGLVRLSVGIEDEADLIGDLERALS